MAMTDERGAIRERRIVLEQKRDHARSEVEAVGLLIRALQIDCRHPAKYRTSHTGESCIDCPDCGKCGVTS